MLPRDERRPSAQLRSQHRKTALLLVLLPVAAASWGPRRGRAIAAPCCSLLLPPTHRHALLLLSLSLALLFVYCGLNPGLPWPVLPATPRDVSIPAAVPAP